MVIFDVERYKYSGLKYLYECGELPPNYPVPAINEPSFYSKDGYGVEWWPDGRMFFWD